MITINKRLTCERWIVTFVYVIFIVVVICSIFINSVNYFLMEIVNYAISRSKIKFQKFAVGKKKPREELFKRNLQCIYAISRSKLKFQKFCGRKEINQERNYSNGICNVLLLLLLFIIHFNIYKNGLFKRNLQCNYAISRSKLKFQKFCGRKEKTRRGIIQS